MCNSVCFERKHTCIEHFYTETTNNKMLYILPPLPFYLNTYSKVAVAITHIISAKTMKFYITALSSYNDICIGKPSMISYTYTIRYCTGNMQQLIISSVHYINYHLQQKRPPTMPLQQSTTSFCKPEDTHDSYV